MRPDEAADLISKVGFPIFISLLMLYIVHRTLADHTKALNRMSSRFSILIEELTGGRRHVGDQDDTED